MLDGINIEVFYKEKNPDPMEREWITEQFNVVEQMKHLLSYPGVKEKYENKTIQILGWYYIIESGDIYNYNIENKRFEIIA